MKASPGGWVSAAAWTDEWNEERRIRKGVDRMTKHRARQIGKTGPAHLRIALLLALGLALAGAAGCGAQKLDRSAETIVITSLSQLEGERFAGFDRLSTLDLRAVDVDTARVDELRAALPSCTILWNVPLGIGKYDSSASELTLPPDCTAQELGLLRYFPSLTRVDATRCAVDGAFAAAAAAYPDVTFSWDVSIGGVAAKSTDTVLDLTGAQVSAAEAESLLRGLSSLEQVVCSGTGWSADELGALEAAYPNIAFSYDVEIFGQRVPSTTAELDLSGAAVDMQALPEALAQFPALTSVDLTGQVATFEQMDALTAAFPQISFDFSFELFSQQVTTRTTELDLDGYPLASLEEIAQKLKYLPDLTYADLSYCGLTNEQMEQLMAQFPQIKFVWVIQIGGWEIRTDITAFSKGNRKSFPNGMGRFTGEGKTNFYNEDIQVLKYCTDLIYLDLGHGNRITDVSVLSQLKKLRVLIVSMNKIEDISPLAELKELECLEIYQNPITDISIVASLPKLRYLNCSSIYIEDITPLLGLDNLEMLWFVNVRHVTKEQRQQLSEALPNCEICFSASSSGEGGWTGNGLYIEYQTAFGLPYNQ